jgi:mevalonate kinase
VILFGEHAVVYGRPAIAVPVFEVQARAVVSPEPRLAPGRVRIQAPDIGLEAFLEDLDPGHPLGAAVSLVLNELGIARPPACTIRVSATIPVAAGLGSGAAVTVALMRALAAFLGKRLPDERISALAFEIEKLHHGTPSGIDNSVVTFAKPVYYRRDHPIETFSVPVPFTLVIADTGVASPTAAAVGDLRRAWQANPQPYETLFDAAGALARQARQLIEEGRPFGLGLLMDENQALLVEMSVSSPELDHLAVAARTAGALGAKLSGGGRGGNMIALVEPQTAAGIAQALTRAGATRTITTEVRNIQRP